MTFKEFIIDMMSENGKISSMRFNMMICTVLGIGCVIAGGFLENELLVQGGGALVGIGVLGKAGQSLVRK